MTNRKPYENRLTYETDNFYVRVVEESDAEDLLNCYSDPKSAPLFNSDNCTCDFVYNDVEELRELIKFWLKEYSSGYYVRFSIIDKNISSSIGTFEMFAKDVIFQGIGRVGVLRLDLMSDYEITHHLEEILSVAQDNFYIDFGVDRIITKVISLAEERITVLKSYGYVEVENLEVSGNDLDYFIG